MHRFSVMRGIWMLLLSFLIWAPTGLAGAPNARLQIDSLDRLADKADSVTIIDLDQRMLAFAGKFLNDGDADEKQARELTQGLEGIYVRSFAFDQDRPYSEADIEAIRTQLRAPGWKRFLQVKSRKEGENVEIYMLVDGDRSQGLAILCIEPRELTVVNIVGPLEPDRLNDLRGQFGVPDSIEVEKTGAQPKPESLDGDKSKPRAKK